MSMLYALRMYNFLLAVFINNNYNDFHYMSKQKWKTTQRLLSELNKRVLKVGDLIVLRRSQDSELKVVVTESS